MRVGTDIGKRVILAVIHWDDGGFERPWLARNPEEMPDFIRLLSEIGRGRELRVAMEPTGIYGDVLR
jgi:transposase